MKKIAVFFLAILVSVGMVGCKQEVNRVVTPTSVSGESTTTSSSQIETQSSSTPSSVTISTPSSSSIVTSKPAATSKPQSVPSVNFTQKDLVGSWVSVYRENNILKFRSLTLKNDGTMEEWCQERANVYYDPFPEEEGWYVIPKGWPTDFGTYKLTGSMLEIVYTHFDYGDYQDRKETYKVLTISNGKMELNDNYGTYVRTNNPYGSLDLSLCDVLGVDYSVG